MIFREIAYSSDDYRRERALRDAVLRRPLGLSLGDEELEAERGQLHFGLFDADGTLLACIVAVPLAAHAAGPRPGGSTPLMNARGPGGTSLSASEGRGPLEGQHASPSPVHAGEPRPGGTSLSASEGRGPLEGQHAFPAPVHAGEPNGLIALSGGPNGPFDAAIGAGQSRC